MRPSLLSRMVRDHHGFQYRATRRFRRFHACGPRHLYFLPHGYVCTETSFIPSRTTPAYYAPECRSAHLPSTTSPARSVARGTGDLARNLGVCIESDDRISRCRSRSLGEYAHTDRRPHADRIACRPFRSLVPSAPLCLGAVRTIRCTPSLMHARSRSGCTSEERRRHSGGGLWVQARGEGVYGNDEVARKEPCTWSYVSTRVTGAPRSMGAPVEERSRCS